MLASSMPSAPLRSASAVRSFGRNIPLSRASVLCRCSSAGSPAPNAPQQQPPKAAPKRSGGLVSVAGDLHLRIDAINVHLTASALPQPGQEELATAVMDAATAAAAAQLAAPTREPAPTAPAPPFTCIGESDAYEVSALAMCSDGHHYVCGYENGDVAVWDVRKPGQRVVAELGNRDWVLSVAASADCERIMAGSKEGLWLWDVEQGNVTQLKNDSRSDKDDQHRDAWCVAITPDGRFGVSGSFQGHLQVWDLERGELIGSKDTTAGGELLGVVISPDGQTATALVEYRDGADCVKVWRWCAGSAFSTPVQLQGSGLQGPYVVPADGGVVLATHSKGMIRIVRQWDGLSGKLEGETAFSTHAGRASGPYLSADGRRAILMHDSAFSVWDVKGKICLATLDGHKGYPCNVAISADGRYAVFDDGDNSRLCIWYLG